MSNLKLTSSSQNWEISAARIYNPNSSLTLDASGNYSLLLKTNGTNRITIDTSANFASPPNCSVAPTASTQLVNKTYVDTTYTTSLVNIIYPIGIIISTSTSTNPGTYITGTTWIAYGQGQTLVGKATSGTFVTPGSTGGNESITISANNLPAHSHPNTLTDLGHQHTLVYQGSQGANRSVYGDYISGAGTNIFTPPTPQAFTASGFSGPAIGASTTTGITISNANNSTTNTAISVLQPYIVVYYWTRTV
jgi:hypothetical protein